MSASATADTVWSWNGSATGVAIGVACDARGNAASTGLIGPNPAQDIWTRKFAGADGANAWTKTVDGGSGDDWGHGIACDSSGDFIAAGMTMKGGDSWTWIRKYRAADGATMWTRSEHGDGSSYQGVACDGQDNVFAAGMLDRPVGKNILLTKYRGSNGSSIWTKAFDVGSGENIAYEVACDEAGDVFVVGSSANGSAFDIWVRKCRGSDGATLWTRKYDGGYDGDIAFGVSCDAGGNPVVVGQVQVAASGQVNGWMRKYKGADGATVWTKTGDDTVFVGVDHGPDDDPVVTGGAWNGADRDVAVIKYSGRNGTLLWQRLDASGHGDDWGRDVSCDYAGNPVVCGSMGIPGYNTAFVRKYRYQPDLSTWYLAEGSTAWGFSDYITIENPNTRGVEATITYMPTGAANVTRKVTLPPASQTTVNPVDDLGQKDFSTTVQCEAGWGIAVDRTMSWTGTGASSPEAHSSVGVTSPAKTWYLPEGSSAWGFECWVLVQNPGAAEATVDFTYMIEGVGPRKVTHKVKARSRETFNMETDIGQHDASVMISSNRPVIPERAMYKNSRREGHESIGTTVPAYDYYLAEGTTAWGFTDYVLVQNPHDTRTDVTITYMTPEGPKVQPEFTMPANSRKTIRVNDISPANGYPIDVSNTDASARVHGSKPIIAERAMYWGSGTPFGEACHDSIGMDTAHTSFYLPDGQTSEGRETWTLVQNPNGADVTVEISYLPSGGGAKSTFNVVVPKNSRMTFNMKDKVPDGRAAVLVTSKTAGRKIMVERAMYWNNRGAGTGTIGGFSN